MTFYARVCFNVFIICCTNNLVTGADENPRPLLIRHEGLSAFCFSIDNQLVATAGADGIIVRSGFTGEAKVRYQANECMALLSHQMVNCVVDMVFVDDRHVLSTGRDGNAFLWHWPSRKLVRRLGHFWIESREDNNPLLMARVPITAMSLSDNDEVALVYRNVVSIWNWKTGDLVQDIGMENLNLRDIESDSTLPDSLNSFLQWSGNERPLAVEYSSKPKTIVDIAFVPNSDLLVATSWKDTYLIDRSDRQIKEVSECGICLAINDSRNLLLTGSPWDGLRLYKLPSMELIESNPTAEISKIGFGLQNDAYGIRNDCLYKIDLDSLTQSPVYGFNRLPNGLSDFRILQARKIALAWFGDYGQITIRTIRDASSTNTDNVTEGRSQKNRD